MVSIDPSTDLFTEYNQYLNAIDGMLMLLAEGGLTEDQGGYLELIWSSIERLKKIGESLQNIQANSSKQEPLTPSWPLGKTNNPLNILVIDEDVVQQLFTKRILEQRGHKVIIAKNGRVGFDYYQHDEFDIIILDCQLSEIDGFQLTKAIRKFEEATDFNIPIIAYTAHTVAGYKQRCFEVGMDEFIKKPTSAAELIQSVENIVKDN